MKNRDFFVDCLVKLLYNNDVHPLSDARRQWNEMGGYENAAFGSDGAHSGYLRH